MLEEHSQYILNYLETNPHPVVAIVGPTCTGKTDLAIDLAKKLDLEIINCDSRLIFSEMNIGTAKPSEAELNLVKHHLVNIKMPNQTYSAGEYRQDFDKVIKAINFDNNSKKPQVLVVGGTGLYVRAALDNLEMPTISRDHELRAELNKLELNELQNILDDLDSTARFEIDIKNKVRIIRAIEIVKLSGKPLKESRSKASSNRYNTAYFGLNFQKRRKLYDLIDSRVVRMINKGLVHEVEALVNNYGITETLLGTIGYKEIIGYLNQEYSLSQARRMIQKKTRLYAKRQMTWFNQNPQLKWLYND
jgi:tRNA dimethylallyltransferase